MAEPASPTRYRCTSCGNLTRFDVTTSRRTREFHHFTVGGELTVEDTQVLSEIVEEVRCRWCGTGASVVVVDPDEDPEAPAVSDGDGDRPPAGGAG